jgi:hypothetical protein
MASLLTSGIPGFWIDDVHSQRQARPAEHLHSQRDRRAAAGHRTEVPRWGRLPTVVITEGSSLA